MATRGWIATMGLAALLAGCSSKSARDESAASNEPDAAAVNALVPEALTKQLRFEVVPGEDDQFWAVVPAGWKQGFIPGSYEPPEGANLGRTTRFRTSSNCDGACSPKDWAAVVAKVEFDRTKSRLPVTRDDATQGSRIRVLGDSSRVEIAAAWWKTGASRYFYCRASLEGPLVAAADAFVKACESMTIRLW